MAPTFAQRRTRDLAAVTADTWVSIEQARTLVGVSRRTIYNWIAAGKIAPEALRRTVGGAIRVRAGALWQSEDGER